MKFLRKLLNLAICISIYSLFITPALADDVAPLVAKVGNVSITNNDLQVEVQKRIPMAVSYHGGIKPEKLEKINKEALQLLINKALKFQYAVSKEISLDTEKFERAWQEHSKKLNPELSPQIIERIKAGLYQELLAKKAEDIVVDQNLAVTEAEIKKYYEENKGNYVQPKTYSASHIFIKVDPSATLEEKAKLREKASQLYEKAKNGEDFYNLAYYNSDDRSRYVGGSLGKFHAGQTVREFDAALKNMKVGDISEPIQTIYGFHIIRLDALEPAQQLSYDQVAGMLKKQVSTKKREKLYREWMTELKKQYPVEIYESH